MNRLSGDADTVVLMVNTHGGQQTAHHRASGAGGAPNLTPITSQHRQCIRKQMLDACSWQRVSGPCEPGFNTLHTCRLQHGLFKDIDSRNFTACSALHNEHAALPICPCTMRSCTPAAIRFLAMRIGKATAWQAREADPRLQTYVFNATYNDSYEKLDAFNAGNCIALTA